MAIYLSASLLDDFVSCSKKTYFRTNKPEESVQDRHMVVGEIVHAAIEKYWDNKDAADDYISYHVNLRLPNDATSLDKAYTCYATYFSNFKQYLLPDDKIELKFKLPIAKDVFIVGRIDRISDGKVFDWKTASVAPSSLSHSIQFMLYNWAYTKLYNRQPSGVYYASLGTGKLIRYSKNNEAEFALFDEIIPSAITAIKNKLYVRDGLFRKTCFRCQYSEACMEEIKNVMEIRSIQNSKR